jgi:hypothetical protein
MCPYNTRGSSYAARPQTHLCGNDESQDHETCSNYYKGSKSLIQTNTKSIYLHSRNPRETLLNRRTKLNGSCRSLKILASTDRIKAPLDVSQKILWSFLT